MGQRAFFRGLPQEHPDDRAHLRLYSDDEDLLVVANKQRASAVGRKNSADLYGHNVVLHASNLVFIARKTSWITPATTGWASPRGACCVFHGWRQSRLARTR